MIALTMITPSNFLLASYLYLVDIDLAHTGIEFAWIQLILSEIGIVNQKNIFYIRNIQEQLQENRTKYFLNYASFFSIKK